ncbi:hypothetical protein M426DRAFT_71296 [Hypoxylon sp. CI-4A]|nr:hypothetical protein M426DRAFT_71296 [Hypoxylon sp. CI-4A]
MRSFTQALGLLASFRFASGSVASDLEKLLSSGATVSTDASTAERWSEFNAPDPGTVVNVATEEDVQITVEYAVKNGNPFFAQSGGHGWSSAWKIGQDGILINLRGLNTVTFSDDKTQATVGGGAIMKEVIDAAYENDVQAFTGNCNCVGLLGAGLGGGYGNLMGIYGFSVDNFLSFNVVLANGSLVTVTPQQEDLWWAIRGAGPNFGIVTSVTMNSTPLAKEKNTAWTGGLYFTEDKIEQVVQAIEDLKLEPEMNIFLYYATSGAPDYTPTVLTTPFYYGTEEEGRAAFKSIIDIGPYNDTTSVLPQNEWNAGADGFCIKGERKPTYSAGINHMVPDTWRSIWNEYTEFLKNPGTGSTAIAVECYSLDKGQSVDWNSASFANRDIRFNSFVITWYPDASLDSTAEAFGSKVRDLWRSTAELPGDRTYVNFAFGDETDQQVYYNSTSRLQQIKKQYDPENIFNQWFDIK